LEAIETAEAWVLNPCEETRLKAAYASVAAKGTYAVSCSSVYYASVYYAAAYYAAYSAASAAYATDAFYYDAYYASSAAYATDAFYYATYDDADFKKKHEELICNIIRKHIPTPEIDGIDE
jgi:hypothetical protein